MKKIIIIFILSSFSVAILSQNVLHRNNLNTESQLFLQKSLETFKANAKFQIYQLSTKDLNNEEFQLNIEGAKIRFSADKIVKHETGIISWFGNMGSGIRVSHFVINLKLNCIHGTFYINDIQHQFIPIGNGSHILVKSRDIIQNKCRNNSAQLDKIKDTDLVFDNMSRAINTAVQRVLFAYTPKAKLVKSDVIGHVINELDIANIAYNRAGVDNFLSLAVVYQTNYSESYTEEICWNDGLANTKTTDLCRFQDDNDGFMDEVHYLRNLYHADMCVLLVDDLVPNTGGQAYDVGAGEEDEAFCVATIGNFATTVAHELGHLQGCHHDRYVLDGILTEYHYGYVYLEGAFSFRTIMSYDDECVDNNIECELIYNYSSPTTTHRGIPTGDVHNPPFDAGHDNSQQIMDTKNLVAAFRDFPTDVYISAGNIGDQEYAFLPAFGTIQNQFFGINTSYIISAGGVVNFETEENIILRPGFHARPGSNFSGSITK